jgi:hypothetical protein
MTEETNKEKSPDPKCARPKTMNEEKQTTNTELVRSMTGTATSSPTS